MTGLNHNISKMFRWLKDKRKAKHERKDKVEDDYGFRKKQIILQETENGHSVIIKDNETTLVYPQSFCRFHYRARMPTPVQNKETSNHIYDEIPEHFVRTRLNLSDAPSANEADLIKDTHRVRDPRMDLRNAIEVGPYLIVPIVNSPDSKGDVEIFKRNADDICETGENDFGMCNCNEEDCSECKASRLDLNHAWDSLTRSAEKIRDTKIVLTRCVKSKTGINDTTNVQQLCSVDKNQRSDLCSFTNGAQSNACESRMFSDSPSNDSNSRTLTGTPDSSTRTPDTLSERSESSAIITGEDEIGNGLSVENVHTCKSDSVLFKETKNSQHSKDPFDGLETNYEFDLSTSGESDHSRTSEKGDYELYLSKIESNLQLKHNVRKLVHDIESMPHGACAEDEDKSDIDSMTYVSSLSEYSSAASHISDVSADRSASDDSSGYYECLEDAQGTRDKDRESHVNLERSVSAPETDPKTIKSKVLSKSKKSKDKTGSKSKKQHYHRSKSFDCRVYKSLSDEDKEMYKFPSNSNSSSSLTSRHSRNKPVLAPQPTPVYMDPYRGGKSGSHNRLLGDLIRMNYDKQLLFH
ncbi:uncharacterized protein LOC123561528 [Mercenaria mercenaria]|uniref:uncharacterized protein LOC123561528 n=1 Tax=Mercenaria mercenaria TaxID=6596 RepID=UPI00234F7AAD|nr:uncharacterized protein LOC123561528 [Mercenaria mercenaria]XP_045209909.2 uncharacterized protein LOC123561528 [Mercenaria mercenaria]XP_045209910.2 uncharacterized protein LOC123561528 [Mercenaria mercenaria]XP_045209911.2 uncharacterized protein LOC123561528 [Mercenaria mercenaria]